MGFKPHATHSTSHLSLPSPSLPKQLYHFDHWSSLQLQSIYQHQPTVPLPSTKHSLYIIGLVQSNVILHVLSQSLAAIYPAMSFIRNVTHSSITIRSLVRDSHVLQFGHPL